MFPELVQYLESLTVTQGARAGEPFAVLPWQRRFLAGTFRPGVRQSALSVARGNGKSTLLAGVAAATLDGPLAVRRGETIVAASSFRQARVIFEHCLAFLGPALERDGRERWRVADSAQTATLEDRQTGARVRCIGSDAQRMHGLAPALVLADEPAQWQSGGDRAYAALATSLGKLPGSRLVALGTLPDSPEHWFSKLCAGGADYAQVHAARPDDPPFQARTIARANPSLAAMPDLADVIKAEARQARRDGGAFAAFAALRLNLGTSDVDRPLLLAAGVWRLCEGDAAERAGPCVWGVDLGGSAASSAIAAYWPATGRLEALAAFPREPDLRTRGARDAVGTLYLDMARRGELVTLGGRAVSIPELVAEAAARFGPPAAVIADRWRAAELTDALEAASIPPGALVLRGMGFKDGAADVRGFRRACLENRVQAPPSLLLASAIAGAVTVTDPAGNAKLAKNVEGGRRKEHRDDAAAAAILAVAEGERQRAAAPARPFRYAIV